MLSNGRSLDESMASVVCNGELVPDTEVIVNTCGTAAVTAAAADKSAT